MFVGNNPHTTHPAGPPPVLDLYTNPDAANATNEQNSFANWTKNSATVTHTVLANTDPGGGGSWMLDMNFSGTASFRASSLVVSGLNLTPHTATIRTRRLSGTSAVFNWLNVSGASYNVDYDSNGTNWFVGTVTFTPTTGSVTIQFYTGVNDGQTVGQIQISEIVITED